MLCWKAFRSDRYTIPLISGAFLCRSHGVSCIYINQLNYSSKTGKERQHNSQNVKLDVFVKKISKRSNRPAQIRPISIRDLKNNVQSEKTAKIRKHISSYKSEVIGASIIKTKKGNVGLQGTKQNITSSETELPTRTLPHISNQHRYDENRVRFRKKEAAENTHLSTGPRISDCEVKSQSDEKEKASQVKILLKNNDSLSVCQKNDKVLTKPKMMNEQNHPLQTVKKHRTDVKKDSEQMHLQLKTKKKLTKNEQTSLQLLISTGKVTEALAEIRAYSSKTCQIPFGILRSFCGLACTQGLTKEILIVKKLTEESHPYLYKNNHCLDNYLASALCYSGDYQGSLDKLYLLYQTDWKSSKKLRDAAAYIIFHIMKSNKEENEQMVVDFAVSMIKRNTLSPALSLWRCGFSSDLYRQQRIADDLTENYPELKKIVPRKLENLVYVAHKNADLNLINRIMGLILKNEFTDYYSLTTAALLYYQCDIGDIAGINQTLKFANAMKVQLKPSHIQRVLFILHQHKKPAPLLLLEMKYRYGLPPKPSPPPKPSSYDYKFQW